MMTNIIAIAGIHTGIGKTIVSAILTEALEADYWKPVQAGLEERDSELVKKLIKAGGKRVHPEAVLLSEPISPHAAAKQDNISIDFTTFLFPETKNTLIVEMAGGVLSPISDTGTMADFIECYKMPVILVVNNYLGSINHTLMSIEVLRNREIKLLGLVINGKENKDSEEFIALYSKSIILFRVPWLENLDQTTISSSALSIKSQLKNLLNG